MQKKPVFFDPTGRRAWRVIGLAWAAILFLLAVGIGFCFSIATVPPPSTGLLSFLQTHVHRIDSGKLAAPDLAKTADLLAVEARARAKAARTARADRFKQTVAPKSLLAETNANPDKPLSIGFYANWDDNSLPSLKRALPQLDSVVPTWIQLTGPNLAMETSVDGRALDYIRQTKPDTPILPMIQNAVDGAFDGPGLGKLLANPKASADLILRLTAFLTSNHFQGLTVDFEEVPPKAHASLQHFLTDLRAAFKPHDLVVILAVPFDDDSWNYPAYAKLVDYMLLMAYDEHYEEGVSGSIASQSWFEDLLDKRMAELDPAQTIVAIGAYGYDWAKGKTADDISFQDAILSAHDSEADIDFDPDSNNPHFSYVEDDGSRHDVWFLDGVTAFNQIHAADVYRPAGYAVWRLGSEDPSLWSVLGRPYGAPAPDGLRAIAMGTDVNFEGTGEILKIRSLPSPGARRFEVDSTYGDIVDENFTTLPTSYIVQRFGNAPHKLALTFDDGPDPVWTPQILDILREKGAKATFFIIGQNAQSNPELVQRILAEGHDIGSHSFTHPNMADIPPSIVALELNATQRLFQAITGRSLRLFRPPYLGDAEPTTADELVPIQQAQSLGYVTVGLHLDPDDWQRPPAEQIISRTLEQLADPNPDVHGQVVLLHDAGGDRTETVKALPGLIDAIRAKGFDLVPISTLAGLSQDEAMPQLPPDQRQALADKPVFMTLSWTGHILYALFLTAVWLGIGRVVFLCVLAIASRLRARRRAPPSVPADPPLISILIPAFNEALVIGKSIDRLLRSDYPKLEIIVIDDGSTDGTSEVVSTRFADDARVVLVKTQNGGKANAINTGLRHVQGEIIVALDADTQFQSDTVSKLVRWFADPEVGAVAGNAKVGNRINVLTRWQALEYITAQNLERRALAALGCVTVVPGAVGAWRRSALEALGGMPTDTLAEDQDLTIAAQKAGHEVLFDPTAIAWTEAPDTLRGLVKQRFRWSFGTLQCLFKHADAIANPRYGTLGIVAMPQVWVFQILFAVISPLVDLLLVWQGIATYIDYLQHRNQFSPDSLEWTGLYYAAFVLVDLVAGAVAFGLERRENWRLLLWLPIQRFGYRQLMYWVVLKSVAAAATGLLVGWGKQDRKATVIATDAAE
jgi:poly-beta-1,6 N-acetyl-D-glucosamine synthase